MLGLGIPSQFEGEPGIASGFDFANEGLGGLVVWLLNLFFLLNLVLSFLYLLWGGITLITAGGDMGKTKQGKDALFFAVFGLGVSILALLSIYTLGKAFGVDLYIPGK